MGSYLKSPFGALLPWKRCGLSWPPLRKVGPGEFPHTPSLLLHLQPAFSLTTCLPGGCGEGVRCPLGPAHSLEGPHLLQHVLGKVFLLVHLQDGLPDLLVRKLQPEVRAPLSRLAWALRRADPRFPQGRWEGLCEPSSLSSSAEPPPTPRTRFTRKLNSEVCQSKPRLGSLVWRPRLRQS